LEAADTEPEPSLHGEFSLKVHPGDLVPRSLGIAPAALEGRVGGDGHLHGAALRGSGQALALPAL